MTLQAEENLGMVMIFTLVTAVQEKLNEIVDLMKTRREEEKRRKEAEAEEAEKVATYIYHIVINQYVYFQRYFSEHISAVYYKHQVSCEL